MVLKRIGPVSAAKITGTLYAVMGLVIGIFFSLFSVLGMTVASGAQSEDRIFGLLFGIGAVLVLPVFYGVLGFVSTLVMAAIYNGLARLLGGVVLEFESHETSTP
jgi:hypothetical protein